MPFKRTMTSRNLFFSIIIMSILLRLKYRIDNEKNSTMNDLLLCVSQEVTLINVLKYKQTTKPVSVFDFV